jgi:hypothetical protein
MSNVTDLQFFLAHILKQWLLETLALSGKLITEEARKLQAPLFQQSIQIMTG